MAIVLADIKLYKSENQTEENNGGGRMSGDIVTSGVVNNLYPNISRIDRLNGRIQLRKVFMKVDSLTDDVYSGSHFIVKTPPGDENVSILTFDTDDVNDLRSEIVEYIEGYYSVTTVVGTASLAYAVPIGTQQIIFKTRHYEYTPQYDENGNLIYTKKVDARYTLNVNVGDLLVLEEAAITEYIQIEQLDTITEELDNSDDKHYYIVEYKVLTLANKLQNAFSAGIIPKNTAINPGWECFGVMELAEAAAIGDAQIRVANSRSRIAPTIERHVTKQNQAFFGPASIENNVEVGFDSTTWSLDNVEQIEVSEAIDVVAGQKAYTHALDNAPLKDGSLEVWYISNGGWYLLEDDGAGAMTGDGTGTIDYETDVASVSLDYQPDVGTKIIYFFERNHNYTEVEHIDLAVAEGIYANQQYLLGINETTLTDTLSDAPVMASTITVYEDVGAGWVELCADNGGGLLTGSGITGTVNYETGAFSLVYDSAVQQNTPIKFEYIKKVEILRSGTISLDPDIYNYLGTLPYAPCKASTVLITLHYYIPDPEYSPATIEFVDDGNGNMVATGLPAGTIDYETGEFQLNWSSSRNNQRFKYSYTSYQNQSVPGGQLPWFLNFNREEIKPGSIYAQYYTDEGGATPWTMRDDGGAGVLRIDSSALGWEQGTAELTTNNKLKSSAAGEGIFVLIEHDEALQSGNLGYIFVSYDGKSFTKKQAGTHEYLMRFAKVVIGNGLLVLYGLRYNATFDGNLFYSDNDGASFTKVVAVAAGHRIKGLAYFSDSVKWVHCSDTEIYTSPDLVNWTLAQSGCAGLSAVIIGKRPDDTPCVLVVGGGGEGYYSTDGVTFTSFNPKVSSCEAIAYDEETRTWIIVGLACAAAVSTDGQAFTAITGLNDLVGLYLDITAIASDGRGTFVAHCQTNGPSSNDLLTIATLDSGETWAIVSNPDINETAHNHYKTLCFGNGMWFYSGRTSADDGFQTSVANMAAMVVADTKITDVGTIDYDSGSGEITAGQIPTSASARYFLIPRHVTDYIVTTRGGVPVETNTLYITAETEAGNFVLLLEDGANPGALIGDGTGVIDYDTGIIELNWTENIKPDSIRLNYTYGAVYRPEYEEINTRSLPLDGFVPVIHDGDIAVISDGINQDMVTVMNVAGNIIDLAQTLSHSYVVGDIVSTAILKGDLQAKKTDDHTQEAWDGTSWEDSGEYTGNPAGDTYDFTGNPLVLTNKGAETERWAIDVVALSPMLVDVIGEHVGTLLTSFDIVAAIEPVNPNTSSPYFSLAAAGWPASGGNWQVGNCLRFNTEAAGAPIWTARIINARSSDTTDDQATVEIRGDVAA